MTSDTVLVVYNPIAGGGSPMVNGDQIAIPSGFFGIVLSLRNSAPGTVKFVFGGRHTVTPLQGCTISVSDVRRLAKLSFFSSLPSSLRGRVRDQVSAAL